MSTRSKTLGVAAAIAAIAVALPTAVQAYADPTPEPSTTTSTTTATTTAEATTTEATTAEATPTEAAPEAAEPAPADTGIPVPTSTKVPDPQGPGCDAYRNQVPTGAGSIDSMALEIGSQALASNPDLSTFSGFISGKLNPDINIVNVLDGGPYVVFAPTNEAFAKLDAKTMETLKNDPVVLLPTLFYHMVLGYLGPNDVAGKMPTQDGRSVTVAGKGGDITVNDAKVVCAYSGRGAYIYMIDTVLTPPTPAAESGGTATSSTETSASESESTSATTTTSEPTTTTSSTPSSTESSTSETTSTSASPTTTTTSAAA